MRNILTIVLLLVASSVFAQNTGIVYKAGATNQTTIQKGGAGVDSLQVLPVIDTARGGAYLSTGTGSIRKKGRILINDSDSTMYYNDGGVWVQVPKLVNGSLEVESIQFDLTPTLSTDIGNLRWNQTDNTLEFVVDDQSTIQIGQEQVVRVVNKTGDTIHDGEAVYVSGAQGNRPKAQLAQADSISTSYIIGVATQDILNNQEGLVTTQGIVRGYNTSNFTAGDKLYLNPDTAGALTNIAPASPNVLACVGLALNSTNNGLICVKPLTPIITDTNLSQSSGVIAPTENAVKKYVDNQIVSETDSLYAVGGNSFGGNSYLGLTDNYRLDIGANSSASIYVHPSTGNVSVASSTDAGYPLSVNGNLLTGDRIRLNDANVEIRDDGDKLRLFGANGIRTTSGNATFPTMFSSFEKEVYSHPAFSGYGIRENHYIKTTVTGNSFISARSSIINLTALTNTGDYTIFIGDEIKPESPGYYLNTNDRLFVRSSIVDSGDAKQWHQVGIHITPSGGAYDSSYMDYEIRGNGEFYSRTGYVAGVYTADASAIAQFDDTARGFLPPRMTGAQGEAISSPAEGLLIYSTDGSGATINSKGWWGYDGSAWVKLN